MKPRSTTTLYRVGRLLPAVAWIVLGTGVAAFAGEEASGWRPAYDLAMRWVNFIILAVVLFKYGRAPLINFLKGQQAATEKEIRELEAEKQKALALVEETRQLVADSSTRFQEITQRIVKEGMDRKLAIIEDARQESRTMLDGVQRKIEGRIARARHRLQGELVDSAVAIALERIPGELKASDHAKFIDQYVAGIETV